MFYDDNTPRPADNKALTNLYKMLLSILSSQILDPANGIYQDGSGERLNSYVEQLKELTGDSVLDDFKVGINQGHNFTFVRADEYLRNLSSLAHYLFDTNETIGYYCSAPPSAGSRKTSSGSSTTVNNHLQAEQTTSVQVEFSQNLISITEALTNFERDHPDETSKENKFAKALKGKLSTVKTSMEIIALVLRIAGEIGLNPQTALKALGL